MKYWMMLCAWGLAGPALAWNSTGHQMVAALAYAQLTPAARARAGSLLALNPDYPRWIEGAHGSLTRRAFIRASVWADDIKSAPDYTDAGDRMEAPEAGEVRGYSDHRRHRYWHVIDTPPEGGAAPTPNVLTQIVALRSVLGDRQASPERRSYALVWLLHLVGDVHQPLHALSRRTYSLPQGDAGGNQVKLTCAPRLKHCAHTLHTFWDDLPGKPGGPEAARRRARSLARTPVAVGSADPAVWVRESVELAWTTVYTAPIGEGEGPYHLTSAYTARARAVARQRLAQAGARLAGLINAQLR